MLNWIGLLFMVLFLLACDVENWTVHYRNAGHILKDIGDQPH